MSELTQQEMPKYLCTKQVWAFKIKKIDITESGAALITPEDEGYGTFLVTSDYMQKHKPQVGGYYVVYKGGYKSYSPADAFEDGYVRIR